MATTDPLVIGLVRCNAGLLICRMNQRILARKGASRAPNTKKQVRKRRGGAEVEAFAYTNMKTSLTNEEIISVAIHDLKLSHRLSRAASTDVTALLECFTDEVHCWDYRTTQRWIEEQTGVKPVSYDCCRKSCMSFAMYPDMGECDYCTLPRWKEVHEEKRVPFATHEYIPITHRLRQWFADPGRAAAMISYRRQAELQGKWVGVKL